MVWPPYEMAKSFGTQRYIANLGHGVTLTPHPITYGVLLMP
jgi:hypothetical protein